MHLYTTKQHTHHTMGHTTQVHYRGISCRSKQGGEYSVEKNDTKKKTGTATCGGAILLVRTRPTQSQPCTWENWINGWGQWQVSDTSSVAPRLVTGSAGSAGSAYKSQGMDHDLLRIWGNLDYGAIK